MKKYILFFVCAILFCSCHQSKTDIVKDYVDVLNCYDKEKMSQYLSDSFMFYGVGIQLNKFEYLDRVDVVKAIEQKTTILETQDLDSIVSAEEKWSTIIDSLLEVTPKVVQKISYRFSGNKLKSITIDTSLNYAEYKKSYDEKTSPCYFYLNSKYDIQDDWDFVRNAKQYITEYANLPASDKNKYRVYAYLQGTFVSDDNPFYRKLVFKGKRTVSIVDAIFGLSFATSYEVDENYIRIRTDQSDLLFEVVDENTLVGEGFAKGTFKKVN